MPLFQIKFDGGVWFEYFQTVLPKKVYGPYVPIYDHFDNL